MPLDFPRQYNAGIAFLALDEDQHRAIHYDRSPAASQLVHHLGRGPTEAEKRKTKKDAADQADYQKLGPDHAKSCAAA